MIRAAAAAVSIAMLAGCANIGDGKLAGKDPQTEFGKRLVRLGGAVSTFLDDHPEAVRALVLARGLACVAKPDTPVICSADRIVAEIAKLKVTVAEARAANEAIQQSDQQIVDALGGLTDAWLIEAAEQTIEVEPAT